MRQLAPAHKSESQPDAELVNGCEEAAARGFTQQGQKHAQLQASASKLRPAPQPEPDSESEPESGEGDEEAAARQRWARLRGLAGPETSSSEEDGGTSDSGTDAGLPSDLDNEEVRLPFRCILNLYAWALDSMDSSRAEHSGGTPPVAHARCAGIMAHPQGAERPPGADCGIWRRAWTPPSGAWGPWRAAWTRPSRCWRARAPRAWRWWTWTWDHVKAADILMVLRSFLAEVHPQAQTPLQ